MDMCAGQTIRDAMNILLSFGKPVRVCVETLDNSISDAIHFFGEFKAESWTDDEGQLHSIYDDPPPSNTMAVDWVLIPEKSCEILHELGVKWDEDSQGFYLLV